MTLPSSAWSRIGLADWGANTPGGNQINNYSARSLYLKNGTQLDHVNGWYFYKNHVIGKLGKSGLPGDYSGYFAVHEATFEIRTFTSEAEWDSYLVANNLKPALWTRWYRTDWTFFDDGIFMFLIFGFFISIPLLLLYCFLLYLSVVKEKLNIRKGNTQLVAVVTGVPMLFWLLEQFPQSI